MPLLLIVNKLHNLLGFLGKLVPVTRRERGNLANISNVGEKVTEINGETKDLVLVNY